MVDALLGLALLVAAESAIVSWLARAEFVGPWELRAGFVRVAPLAWLGTLPAALFGTLVLGLGSARTRRADAVAATLLSVASGAVAVGVSGGRHFAWLPLRVAFVTIVAAAGFAATFYGLRRVTSALERAPVAAAFAALAIAAAAEMANVHVLPRLYPAFHAALLAVAAMIAPIWGRLLPPDDVLGAGDRRVPWRLLALALPWWVVAYAPSNARALSLADNVRFIFVDRAPILRVGIEVAAKLAPPPPLDAPLAIDLPHADHRLNLDWRERDILLVTVDALRADHVGAYGYARPTTPHLDALAGEGTLFWRAYCPTPHTSYSVTSMMTGKNMRPLLLQGLGTESDTAAGLLRTYGYRTAAFYPPAVFFIDEDAFVRYRDRRLDFEYARIEFAAPNARAAALRAYLASQPAERKVFVWVHLFEPHEPYVTHPEHAWGDRDVDRYDSEIAAADSGIGEIVAIMRARRPDPVVMVTADHGEEFGDHGGRYHGTTVYEEQVRVPLVIVGPGVARGRRVAAPVQTIDLLPTMLAALDVPRPPRVRGNELSGWLKHDDHRSAAATDGGQSAGSGIPAVAFAETEEQTLLAEAEWRLVCARRVGACALYNLELDPSEQHDVSSLHPARFGDMRATLARLQASHGTYETAPGARPWPEAIRRGLAGDADAARDVAELLDDSDVVFRRKAAEVLFDLKRAEAAPHLHLALARDDDDLVRRWCALALTRLGEVVPRTAELLDDPDAAFRRLAALALAENGSDRGRAILVSWWQQGPPPFARARELLGALAAIRAKEAVPALIDALADVRLRPYVAATLGALGHPAARPVLATYWAEERYHDTRGALGDALARLGATPAQLVGPLVRFLGTPDPLVGGLALAARAGVLQQVGGPSAEQLAQLQAARQGDPVRIVVRPPAGGKGEGLRLLVRARATGNQAGEVVIRSPPRDPLRHLSAMDGGAPTPMPDAAIAASDALSFVFSDRDAREHFATLPPEMTAQGHGPELALMVTLHGVAVEAAAVVPLADELPPPPPTPWTPPASEAPDAAPPSPH